jgi:hypothetical protein
MTLSDPRELLQDVSEAKYVEYLTQCKSWRRSSAEDGGDQEKQTSSEVHYVEPCMLHGPTTPIRVNTLSPISVNHPLSDTSLQRIQSRIYRLGDYVDTDAVRSLFWRFVPLLTLLNLDHPSSRMCFQPE